MVRIKRRGLVLAYNQTVAFTCQGDVAINHQCEHDVDVVKVCITRGLGDAGRCHGYQTDLSVIRQESSLRLPLYEH